MDTGFLRSMQTDKGYPMSQNQQPMDDAGRKRHLEALFADEPFLSPTMKARRMHEKLYEMRATEADFGDRMTGTSLVLDTPFSIAIRDEPAFMRPDSTLISFAEAAMRLRSGDGSSRFGMSMADPIDAFRTQVLALWVQKVDRRESEDAAPRDPRRSAAPRHSARNMDEK
jgi:hypothetical protein